MLSRAFDYCRALDYCSLTTVITTVVAITGASMLFSLVSIRTSHDVRTSILNIQYGINNDLGLSSKTNAILMADLTKDSVSKDQALNQANELASSISSLSNNLCFAIVRSLDEETSDEEFKRIMKEQYTLISDNAGSLLVLREEGKGIKDLVGLIDQYKANYQSITGIEANLNLNHDNLDYYITTEKIDFPLGIVIHDLSLLNLQVQRLHTGLLQYYKGKVS